MRPPRSAAGPPGPELPGRPLPPTPPPSPWAAGGRPERRRPRTPPGGQLHPSEGRHSRSERSRAPSASRRPPAHSCITRCRPAALRRGLGPQPNGGIQVCADEAAGLGARLGKAGEQTVARRPLFHPPQLATLTHRRPTGPRLAPTTARQPRLNVYAQGGCAGEEGGQGRGPRATPQGRGVGNSGAAPPSPLPRTPPRPAGRGGASPPPSPRPKGRNPSARRDRDARGGTGLDPHAAHPGNPHSPLPAPAGVATGGQTRTSAQEQRTGHARGRHRTTNRSCMGAAPPMT